MPRTVATVVLFAAVAACSCGHSHIHATFLDATIGQTKVETLDSDRIAIANYKDGRLRGLEMAHELHRTWVYDWIESRVPVDHPQLPQWEDQLRRMREEADQRGIDPDPLLRAAMGFPFSQGRYDCIATWVGEEPERAAQLLDRYAALDPGKSAATKLATLAMKDPHGDDRLARWIEAMAAENHRDAALVVARSQQAGPRTADATLRLLGSFSSSSRKDLFEAVAPRVASRNGSARLIVDAVDELSSNDEAPAMLLLLTSDTADVELGLRVLRALGDFRSSDRAALYGECARIVGADTSGADALVAALSSLRSNDRLGAARAAMQKNDNAHLVAGLLRAAGDLPSRDRARLIEAALQQPLWTPVIERAALHAVGEVSGRSSRQQIRDAVEQHAAQRRGQ